MPITVLDYVKAKVGDQETYSEHDHWRAGVALIGGCQTCPATIASYNAYPSVSGYWRCADCIGDDGFVTVEDFQISIRARCPSCGNVDNIHEGRIITANIATARYTPEYLLECGDCGEVWQP